MPQRTTNKKHFVEIEDGRVVKRGVRENISNRSVFNFSRASEATAGHQYGDEKIVSSSSLDPSILLSFDSLNVLRDATGSLFPLDYGLSGSLVYFNPDIARTASLSTGEKAVLIEGQKQNYLDTLINNWSAVGTTITPGQTGPDNSTDAVIVEYTEADDDGPLYFFNEDVPNSGTFTFSVFAKEIEGQVSSSVFRLGFLRSSSQLNFSNDISASGDWRRYDFTGLIPSGSILAQAQILNASTSGSRTILFFGPQVETGSFRSSYIRANGSSLLVTRNVDFITSSTEMTWPSWRFSVIPIYSSSIFTTEIGTQYLYKNTGNSNIRIVGKSGEDDFIRLGSDSPNLATYIDHSASFSGSEVLNLYIERAKGVFSSKGQSTLTGSWTVNSSNTFIGSNAGASPFFGLIGEPKFHKPPF